MHGHQKEWAGGERFSEGRGYRTARGYLNVKPYSTIPCNMTVTHNKNQCSGLGRNMV